jgi:hypothetical protein
MADWVYVLRTAAPVTDRWPSGVGSRFNRYQSHSL